MKKIRTRQKPDVAGKPVDLIEVSKLAFMIGFDVARLSSPDEIELAALKALQQLSACRDKRTRSRDFAVLIGTMRNRIGMDVLGVCLPERISSKVVRYFDTALGPFDRVDTGAYPTGDLSLKALARYSDGKIIVYTDASSPVGWLPSKAETIKTWNCAWETRSAELLTPTVSSSPGYNPIPESLAPTQPVVGGHSLEDYDRLGEVLDSMLLPMPQSWEEARSKVPFGYQHLRSFCASHLGISVQEQDLPGNCSAALRIGRPYATASGIGAEVMIRINRSLPSATKYVALGHELAHYRLHFPWLLAASAAFDLSLEFPEVIVFLQNFFLKKDPKLRKLEEQADFYSSYFLLSPIVDKLDEVARHMLMGGRQPMPEQLAWIWLRPFFPNEGVPTGTWQEYRALSKRALIVLRELSSGIEPRSLLERYFSAMVRRLRREYSMVFDPDMLKDVVQLMALFEAGSARARRDRLRRTIETKAQTEGWRKPASVEEFMEWASGLAQSQLGLAGEVSTKIILPQQRAAEDFLCPIAVLVPSNFNPDGRAQPELVSLPCMSDALATTREGWIRRLPTYGFIIADISREVRAFLMKDSTDLRHLVILPTSWNLEMKPDGEWYEVGIYEAGHAIEMSKDRAVGTLDEWARFCVPRGLGLRIERLSEAQVSELRRIKKVDPNVALHIHQSATNSRDVGRMIKKAKVALPIDVLPWEKDDYFETDREEWKYIVGSEDDDDDPWSGLFKSDREAIKKLEAEAAVTPKVEISEVDIEANKYAWRFIQDCLAGELLDEGFWPMMFEVDEILKSRGVRLDVREETWEVLRVLIVDEEFCGDFFRTSECANCGRSFLPVLNKQCVQATLRPGKILCGQCSEQCNEEKRRVIGL